MKTSVYQSTALAKQCNISGLRRYRTCPNVNIMWTKPVRYSLIRKFFSEYREHSPTLGPVVIRLVTEEEGDYYEQ